MSMPTHESAAPIGRSPTSADRLPGRLALGVVLCAILAVTGVIYASAAMSRANKRALTPDAGLAGMTVPEFRLTAQDGREYTRADLKDRLTVVNFIFTNCPYICPALGQKMKGLQDSLKDTGVRLLSISVDPKHDTPEALAAYARKIGADPAVWTFVTGDFATVKRISEDGLKLALGEDPTRPITLGDGTVMDNIAHTGKLVLIGPDVTVLAMHSGLDQADVDRLAKRVRRTIR